MKEWFLARGYPEIVVNNQINKVFGRDQCVKKNLESDIPFVTTYHPKGKELGKMIRTYFPFYTVMEKFQRFLTFSNCMLQKCKKNKKSYGEI